MSLVNLAVLSVMQSGICTPAADVVLSGVHHQYEDTTIMKLCMGARMHRNHIFVESCSPCIITNDGNNKNCNINKTIIQYINNTK